MRARAGRFVENSQEHSIKDSFLSKKVAIVYNVGMKNSFEALNTLKKLLESKGVAFESFTLDEMKSGFDFVFVIGGDGTLLKAAKFYSHESTPVFGINLGRLGFLAQSRENEIAESVEKIINNRYKVEDRLMLSSDNDTLALNDFVIKGSLHSRTSRFYLSINDKFVCDYLADGLIISTPTGSTAYGLSAGGPVLSPSLDALVIVPICPHTLNARPLVVPSSEKITVTTCDTCLSFIVISDGQTTYDADGKIEIKKSEFCAKLALLEDDEFYSVLRDKLHWGISPKS